MQTSSTTAHRKPGLVVAPNQTTVQSTATLPRNEIFDDPAPANLSTTFSVGSTAVTSAATSSTSSTSNTIQTSSSSTSSAAATKSSALPSQTGTSQPSSGGGGGLSTGAKAGIGVGVAIGAIVVLAGILLFLRRRPNENMRPRATEMAGNGHESKVLMQELGTQREPERAVLNSDPREVVHEM